MVGYGRCVKAARGLDRPGQARQARLGTAGPGVAR